MKRGTAGAVMGADLRSRAQKLHHVLRLAVDARLMITHNAVGQTPRSAASCIGALPLNVCGCMAML